MKPRLVFSALALLAACQRPPVTQTAPAASAVRPPAPDAPLRGTRWVVRQVAGRPVQTPAEGHEAYLLLRADNSAEGQGGCNRFRGPATVAEPAALRFGPLLSTRMACPQLDAETSFTQALTATRRYQISGDTLRLFGAEGNAPLVRLEAVYLR